MAFMTSNCVPRPMALPTPRLRAPSRTMPRKPIRAARSSASIISGFGAPSTPPARTLPPIAGAEVRSDARRGVSQRARQRKHHVLFAAFQFFGRGPAPFTQACNHLLHQFLGRGGAGSHAHGALALEPFALQEGRIVDEITGPSRAFGQLAQAIRIGTGDRADHDEHV